MIVDARRSNCWFDTPSGVSLPTGDAFAELEMDAGSNVYTSELDIANAFYMMQLPAPLRDLFCFPSLVARWIGKDVVTVEGSTVRGNTLIFPQMTVVPMGWSHALWWCQSLHEHLVDEAGLEPCQRLTDKARAPVLGKRRHPSLGVC